MTGAILFAVFLGLMLAGVPIVVNASSGKGVLGFTFRSLLGFHKLYSRVLLLAARSRLIRHLRKKD